LEEGDVDEAWSLEEREVSLVLAFTVRGAWPGDATGYVRNMWV
jgi:hypothetical protein